MSELRVMDGSGDTKIIWSEDNQDEVGAAKATFERLTGKGYVAYSVRKDGEKNSIVKKFDPSAEKIILVPPVVGG